MSAEMIVTTAHMVLMVGAGGLVLASLGAVVRLLKDLSR